MITENLSTLDVHKLTKAQYERELAAGRIDENAIYLLPEEEIDFSNIIDSTLSFSDGVLKVNTTDAAEADNTLPITSAGVYAQLGNIEALLETI